MSMRSPDDRLFIEIRSAYHRARADRDYSAVQRITRTNFNWLMDYMETKLSLNLSRKARPVKKWKALRGYLEDCQDSMPKSSAIGREAKGKFKKAADMVSDIIYLHDPKPTKERL